MLQQLTKRRIEDFYRDVEKLDLKFPVAAISKATGQGKGNVSRYLKKSLQPSQAFLNKFYNAFSESIKNVSREIQTGENEKVQTVTTKPVFEMQPSTGSNGKDAIIKTLADTTKSQQELISELAKNVMQLSTKLIEKK